jgi:hypothetical protein
MPEEVGKRRRKKQAGAELCKAQVKLDLAKPAIAEIDFQRTISLGENKHRFYSTMMITLLQDLTI